MHSSRRDPRAASAGRPDLSPALARALPPLSRKHHDQVPLLSSAPVPGLGLRGALKGMGITAYEAHLLPNTPGGPGSDGGRGAPSGEPLWAMELSSPRDSPKKSPECRPTGLQRRHDRTAPTPSPRRPLSRPRWRPASSASPGLCLHQGPSGPVSFPVSSFPLSLSSVSPQRPFPPSSSISLPPPFLHSSKFLCLCFCFSSRFSFLSLSCEV